MDMLRALLALIAEKFADGVFKLTGSAKAGLWRGLQLSLRQIKHGPLLSIGCHVYVRNPGSLVLGNRCAIGSFTRIWNYAPIVIGDDFMSAGGLTLNSATHDPVTLAPQGKPITIGRRVWCGLNVTILAGVSIGDDVVVGAGSVVTKSLPSGIIAAGVPARKIRDLQRSPGVQIHSWTGASITMDENEPSEL